MASTTTAMANRLDAECRLIRAQARFGALLKMMAWERTDGELTIAGDEVSAACRNLDAWKRAEATDNMLDATRILP